MRAAPSAGIVPLHGLAMLTLQRLKIHKCRSVRPGTELEFNGSYNVFLGKNGAGKTTLLKLIAAAIGSSFQDEFRADELHVEYAYRFGEIQIDCQYIVEHEHSSAASSTLLRSWTFRATLRAPSSEPMIVEMVDNHIRYRSAGKTWEKEVGPYVSIAPSLDLIALIVGQLPDGDAPPFRALHAATRMTHRLDEGLDWLRDALENFRVLFTPRNDEDRWCNPSTPYSGATTELRAALSGFRGKFEALPDTIVLHSDALAFLRRLCEQLDLREATWILSFLEHERRGNEIKTYGRSQIYVTTRGGTRLPLEKLSYGQRRLFAFLFHSFTHPHAIVADELTNGMHHAMVDACFDTIGRRQAFLATQNPLLLDHIGFESAEEARRTFILCDLERGDDGEQVMLWRNMTTGESEEFFRDYQVGIQHVNDILRTRGLW